MQNYLKDNITSIILIIFAAGGLYSEFRMMKSQVETLERRLEKKIKILNEHDKRLYKLEKNTSKELD
jgi:hypothetical protein